jgi:MFS family permease
MGLPNGGGSAATETLPPSSLTRVIWSASAGTVIEWYDFYIFGSLSGIISAHFFPQTDPAVDFLKTLAIFATGFVVRPFGAVFFGRIGDLVGRKYAFLVTLILMGGGTAAIGIIPGYASIGIAAPIILVVLRLLQGLALGGEYGGAATYVAEHAPDNRRGFCTSFIQITATAGLFVSLGVIEATREIVGKEAFQAWGWRVPFILSILLVAVSFYIRYKLRESPLFTKLKASGKTSKRPLADSLGSRKNWGMMMLALFGATAGQGVVWYTGQFYALIFLQQTLQIGDRPANFIVATALLLAAPFFVVFGALSDRIGRKKIMMAGCALAVGTYLPLYHAMTAFSSPANYVALTAIVFVQVLYVTMVYGPIAAFLVEFFPTKIRYTSLSLPYHLGNGVFGGLTPFLASSIVAATGNIYAGLFYPMGIATVTFVVGMLFLPETRHISIWDEVERETAAAGPAFPAKE